jgi:hypothetical protein
VERLEDRTTPSVNLATAFAGESLNDTTCGCEPPDTIAAAGPSQVVEAVNTALRFYDKSGNILKTQEFATFFASLNPESLSDPLVFFDPAIGNGAGNPAGRFVVGILDFNQGANHSNLDIAVSNDANPLDGFTEMHKIDMTEGASWFADYPRFGYNADAIVVAFNQFAQSGFGNFDHVRLLQIDLSTVTDANNSTFASYQENTGNSSDFTLVPAIMHDAASGGPMYLVEGTNLGGGANTVNVVQMTSELSSHPTLAYTSIPVTSYNAPPGAIQQGGGSINTNDSRMLQVAWRGDRLLATHAIGVGSDAHARWYEFNTNSGGAPTLTQQGDVNQGAGVSTFFPAIDIASNGDVGITFMESSASEYMSMYVTGRTNADAAGTMETPVLVAAGQANYTGGRAGDFSGLSVDPANTTQFWAANEYKPISAFWGTYLGNFSLSVPAGPSVASSTPSGAYGASSVSSISFTFNAAMDTSSFSVADDVDSFTGPGSVDLKGQITGYSWSADAKTLTVNFNSQTASGAYSMAIGPNILRASDEAPMDQNGNGASGEIPGDEYTDSFTLSTSRVLEDFESGNLKAYSIYPGRTKTAYVNGQSRHDGNFGLYDYNGNDWIDRTDANATIKQGDSVSVWSQLHTKADGRAYFGFGWTNNKTLAAVEAPNTGQLLIQYFDGTNYNTLAAVNQTYSVNHWYKLEVDWSTSGGVTVRLFDSDGKTQLNSVNVASTGTNITSGGFGFRALGSNKYWDTVTLMPGAGNSTQAKGNTPSLTPDPVEADFTRDGVGAGPYHPVRTKADIEKPGDEDDGKTMNTPSTGVSSSKTTRLLDGAAGSRIQDVDAFFAVLADTRAKQPS